MAWIRETLVCAVLKAVRPRKCVVLVLELGKVNGGLKLLLNSGLVLRVVSDVVNR